MLTIAWICALGGSRVAASGGSVEHREAPPRPAARDQVTIPARPARPVFQGEQGERWSSEISFDRQTRTVTVKLAVQDTNGYFIPNLRRQNFAVYEDGVRQNNVTVEIEHAPVTLSVLLEAGGRYQQLNRFLRDQIPLLARPLLDVLGRDDKLALFSYADAVQTLVGFDQPLAGFESAIDRPAPPGFSEANLYDAVIDVLNRMHGVRGRKAVLLMSTGLDTFSHATFDDVVGAAEQSDTPVYGIGLSEMARSLVGTTGPLSKIDWKRAADHIETLAKVSGGRAYLVESTIDVPAIYDDIMEHLRVRYVITYVSSNPANTGGPRTVKVALVDPKSGGPLRIVDATGKTITARVVVQASYTP